MSFLWKILWEWNGNRVDTFGRKASKHYLICLYPLSAWSALAITIVQNLMYRAICIHSSPWFSKRIYFYPPNILQFIYHKEALLLWQFSSGCISWKSVSTSPWLLIPVWLTASRRWPLSGKKQRDFSGITKSLFRKQSLLPTTYSFPLSIQQREISHGNLPSCIYPLGDSKPLSAHYIGLFGQNSYLEMSPFHGRVLSLICRVGRSL